MDADRVLVKAAQAGDADAIDTLVRRYQVRMFNERDLGLEAHDTDTHGYTEINVAAVALVGRRFCPRMRRLHRQRISCADPARDHGVLEPVLPRGRRAVHVRLIAEQGDRIGQFDATLRSRRAMSRTQAPCALRIAISSRSAKDRERADRGAKLIGGIPPPSRNQRPPTGGDTPHDTAASSLDSPRVIACQNRCCSSRPATGGRPGERIAGRPARSDRLRFRFSIAAPHHRGVATTS